MAPNPSPGVTGTTVQMNLASLVKASRMLDPNLKRFAIVGDRLDAHPHYIRTARNCPFIPGNLNLLT